MQLFRDSIKLVKRADHKLNCEVTISIILFDSSSVVINFNFKLKWMSMECNHVLKLGYLPDGGHVMKGRILALFQLVTRC